MEFMRGIYAEAQRSSLQAGGPRPPGGLPAGELEFSSGGLAPDPAEMDGSTAVPGSVRQRKDRRRDAPDADMATPYPLPQPYSRQGGGPLDEQLDVTFSAVSEAAFTTEFRKDVNDSVVRPSERELEHGSDRVSHLSPPARRHDDGPARQEPHSGFERTGRVSGDSPSSSHQAQNPLAPGHSAHRSGSASAFFFTTYDFPHDDSQHALSPEGELDDDGPPGHSPNQSSHGSVSLAPTAPVVDGSAGPFERSLPRPRSGRPGVREAADGTAAGDASSPAEPAALTDKAPAAVSHAVVGREDRLVGSTDRPPNAHRGVRRTRSPSDALFDAVPDADDVALAPTPVPDPVAPAREAPAVEPIPRDVADPSPSSAAGLHIGRVEVVVEEAGVEAASSPSTSAWKSVSSRRYMRRP